MSATRKAANTLAPDRVTTAVPYASLVLSDIPYAYWRLNETGTAMTDASGNGRTLTLSAVTGTGSAGLITNDTDKCWDAPGNAYGSCPSPSNAAGDPFTVEAWIRPHAMGSYHAVVTRDATSPRGWNLYTLDGKLYGNLTGGGVTGATTLSTGAIYHVAMTYDGSYTRLYLNGVLDGTSGLMTMQHPSNPILVGASYAGTGTPNNFQFDGKIDEVAYYASALSADRLLAHYVKGSS